MRTWQKSFTLIEIIIVIIVISVLASLGIVQYTRAVDIAVERDAVLQLRTLYTANELYYYRNKEYFPANTSVGVAAINAGLGTNLVQEKLIYSYRRIRADYYEATATYTGRFVVGMNSYTINVSKAVPSRGMDFFVDTAWATIIPTTTPPRTNPPINTRAPKPPIVTTIPPGSHLPPTVPPVTLPPETTTPPVTTAAPDPTTVAPPTPPPPETTAAPTVTPAPPPAGYNNPCCYSGEDCPTLPKCYW